MLMAQLSNDMRDWSELHFDLLVLIVNRISLIDDYLNFGMVCKSWKSVVTKNNFNNDLPRVPWLMLAEQEEDNEDSSCRRFFSLYNGMILRKRIPKARGKRCMESMGWLITLGKDGEISLLHPFSGVEIELPHQNTTQDYDAHQTSEPFFFISKAVLSASPSHTSDFVLMVIDGGWRFLSFWRPGDLRWTRISWEENSHCPYMDLIYSDGHFYTINCNGCVLRWHISGSEPPKSHMVLQIPFTRNHRKDQLYVLKSLESLFVVVRNGGALRFPIKDCDMIPLTFIRIGNEDQDLTYGTYEFQVFHLDLATGQCKQTTELGDRACFVGQSTSLLVQAASQFSEIKSNHIYFTDDDWESYISYEEGGGFDMGVFNLADGSIQRHYKDNSLSRISPPIWVTPTLR